MTKKLRFIPTIQKNDFYGFQIYYYFIITFYSNFPHLYNMIGTQCVYNKSFVTSKVQFRLIFKYYNIRLDMIIICYPCLWFLINTFFILVIVCVKLLKLKIFFLLVFTYFIQKCFLRVKSNFFFKLLFHIVFFSALCGLLNTLCNVLNLDS